MKILHFIYDHIKNPWVGGGGAVRCYELYKILSNKSYDVTVISGKFPKISNYEVNKNFRFKFLGKELSYIFSVFSYVYYANRFLRKNYMKFDIIIEDFAPWNPIFTYKVQNKIPVILQIHHKENLNILKKYNLLGIPFYYLEKFYPLKFFNIISVSNITAKKFNLKKFEVISNGISIDFFKIPLIKGNYILYIGRIDIYNKGIDLLLKINNNYNIVIGGKGKDEHKLKKLIANKPNIKFIGYVSKEEKIELFKNAKFLIMPSRFEGQGIIALEAAAAGKPVIVSNIPELNYVVKNGFGISFKSEDYIDLEKKIEFLLNNENKVIEMGRNGKKYAKNFTWKKIAEKYENYILKIVNGGKNGSTN